MGKDFKGDFLRTVGEILKRARITKPMSIHYILHARVPIINFVDAQWGIECDLSISSDTAQFKAASVRSLSTIDPRFEPLYRVIKAFVKAHNLNDGSRKTFNSWCLILIFISYLQSNKCPAGVMLPKLRDLFFAEDEQEEGRILSPESKYDAGAALDVARVRAMRARDQFAEKRKNARSPPLIELLMGFLDFVLDLLNHALEAGPDQDRICLTPWTGSLTRIPAGSDKFGNGRKGSPTFLVEDPFDEHDNVARTLGTWTEDSRTTLGFLIMAFGSARDLLRGLMISPPPGLSLNDVKENEVRKAREALGWIYGPSFLVDVPSLCPAIFSPRLRDICIQGLNRRQVTPGDLTRSKGISPTSAIGTNWDQKHTLYFLD